MGYPMTWWRLVSRNGLWGDYAQSSNDHGSRSVAGDMRRLEQDCRDDAHLKEVSELANITPEQAKIVLDWFFRETPFIINNWAYTKLPENLK